MQENRNAKILSASQGDQKRINKRGQKTKGKIKNEMVENQLN